MPILSPYDGISVTVPNDGNPHQLFLLLKAVNPNVSWRCHYLVIQNDPTRSNDSVLIGGGPTDSQGAANPAVLSATNYGTIIAQGESQTFTGFRDEDFNIARYWVRTTGVGTVVLNVQIVRG